jgi:uncharacterized protein
MNKQKTVIIIHGTYGHNKENWIPWLKSKLEGQGCKVLASNYPTPENQNYNSWSKVLKADLDKVEQGSELTIIAHSSGVPFVISFISKTCITVDKLITISGFYGFESQKPEFKLINKINKGFYFYDTEFDLVRKFAKNRISFISNNDPYIPKSDLELLTKLIDAKVINIEDGGHFNQDSGYLEFEELLGCILD